MAIDEVGGSSEAAAPSAERAGDSFAGDAPAPEIEATTAGGATAASATSTGARGAHWLVFFGLAVTVLVLDQLTKAWLTSRLSPGEMLSILGDYVRLVFSQNSGALFGLFRDNAVLFGIVSIVVIGLIILYHRQVGSSLYLSIALGFLLGGALGNMTDRLRLGYVVDFVDWYIGQYHWPAFNIADSAIVGGAIGLVVFGFGERKTQE